MMCTSVIRGAAFLMAAGWLLQALQAALAADAGVWIPLRTAEGQRPSSPCPERIYLGGRGESYAEGIRRTGNFRPFASGEVSVSKPVPGTLRYSVRLRSLFEGCASAGTYKPGLFKGESYSYTFGNGQLTLDVLAGASLRIKNHGVFRMQPVFDVLENL